MIIGDRYQGWARETIDEWHSCESGGGTLTRYATQWGAAIGMVCGFALNLRLAVRVPVCIAFLVRLSVP